MVKTLERDRYALCEKHFLFPFCCSYQVYRYLAGCFGLISGRHYLAKNTKIYDRWDQEALFKKFCKRDFCDEVRDFKIPEPEAVAS